MDSKRLIRIKNFHRLRYNYIKKLPNDYYIINPLSPLSLTVGPVEKNVAKRIKDALPFSSEKKSIEKLAIIYSENAFRCVEIDNFLIKSKSAEYKKATLETYFKLLKNTFIAGEETLNVIDRYIAHQKLKFESESKSSNSFFSKIREKISDYRFQTFLKSKEKKEFLKNLEDYIGGLPKEKMPYINKFYITSKGCSKACKKKEILNGVEELPKELPPFFPGCVCELHYDIYLPEHPKNVELEDWYLKLKWD